MKTRLAILTLSVAAIPATVGAAEPRPRPPVVEEVFACRAVVDPAGRLACFDRTVGAFDTAAKNEDVVVSDKATIRQAKRGIFGFSLPSIRLFRDDDSSEDVKSIEGKLTRVGRTADGGLLLTLDTGARWQQVDAAYVNQPRAGQTVEISRAALSGYMAKVEKGRGFRVRRLAE